MNRQTLTGLVVASGLALLVATGGCGSDDPPGKAADSPSAATSGSATVTSTAEETSTRTTSATSTSPSTATESTSRTTAGTTPAAGGQQPTVADLVRTLEAEILADYPYIGPGTVQCDGSGPLPEWSTILCGYLPDDPAEFGGIHVSVLDRGLFTWAFGECCDGSPWPDDYPAGAMCRDLAQPPPYDGPEEFRRPPEYHLTYGLAVFYWIDEGRPARMDADGNGIPCETVYPAGDVSAFWDSARPIVTAA